MANCKDISHSIDNANTVVVTKYDLTRTESKTFQSEAQLEKEFINLLQKQGYVYLPAIKNEEKLKENLRLKLEQLNNIKFSNAEWERFF